MNPTLGVMIFALGGLAGAVFYLPFKKVKNWAWESYWMIYAVVGLIVVPWVLAYYTSPNVVAVLKNTPTKTLGYCFACGAMWGLGGFTWGLMIRYLGVGLGLAIGCGLCSAAGTIMPSILEGNVEKLYNTGFAKVALAGVAVSLVGIVLVGMAGMSKESELPEEEKKKAVAEYNFKKGLCIAIFSGLMSAGMGFGLQGGPTIDLMAQHGSQTQFISSKDAAQSPAEWAAIPDSNKFYDKDAKFWFAPAVAEGETATSKTWRGMPTLVVVLAGGFVVNFLYCLFWNLKNKTANDYVRGAVPANLFFAGVAGAIWCTQFICFKTGGTALEGSEYVGWAVLMASSILFSALLGIILGEWAGTSSRTRKRLAAGLVLLALSSVAVGYSGHLKEQAKNQKAQETPVVACASYSIVK